MEDYRFRDVLSVEELEPLLEQAKLTAQKIVERKEELSPDMSSELLREQLVLLEELKQSTSLAAQTAEALFLSETQEETFRQARSRVERETTDIAESLLYFGLTLKSWSLKRLEWYANELPQYKEYFLDVARHASHALTEPEERVILLKNKTGGSVHEKLYTMITSKFSYSLNIDGVEHTLTDGELRPYLIHERRDIRKAAMEAGVVPYEKNKDELGELYFAIAEDFDTETVDLRKYESPIAARHLGNTLPAQAYEALVASAKKNQRIYQEFITVKQRILGLEDFQRWDFNAPVPGLPKGMPYEDARKLVLDVFRKFAPWLHDHAESVFDASRVDNLPRNGKRGGAFCVPMVPGVLPLVLLNHNETFDALSTMAHELGHAVHEILSQQNSILVWDPPLVLAETASTFCEQLLLQDVLKRANAHTRRALLCHMVDETLRSIPTQLRYTRFEERAHEMVRQGATASEIDKMWTDLQREDFPTVPFAQTSVQWRSIPHLFSNPFYCYSYAFGQLLVLALWRKHEEEGPAFAPKLKAILSSGGSVPPAELLERYGFDITQESFWDGGFKVIEGWVSELRRTV